MATAPTRLSHAARMGTWLAGWLGLALFGAAFTSLSVVTSGHRSAWAHRVTTVQPCSVQRALVEVIIVQVLRDSLDLDPLAGLQLATLHLLEQLVQLLAFEVRDGLLYQLHGAARVLLRHQHVGGRRRHRAQMGEHVRQHLGAPHRHHEALLLQDGSHHLGQGHGRGNVHDRPVVTVHHQALALHTALLAPGQPGPADGRKLLLRARPRSEYPMIRSFSYAPGAWSYTQGRS